MLHSFLRQGVFLLLTAFMLSLLSYVILMQDPLNAELATPHFYQGYIHYLNRLMHGDLGISYNGGDPLKSTILTVLPPTLELCCCAILLAVIFGIPLGILGAAYQTHFIGKTIRTLSAIGTALPVFWIAPILLYFSAINAWQISAIGQYNLLYEIKPLTGFPLIDVWFVDAPYRIKMIQNVLQHLALPTLVLSILPMMEIVRLVQQRAEIVLQQNYVKIVTTRGWSKLTILRKYVLRNTLPLLIPQMTRLFTLVITQCMLIENTLGWPGIGRWLIDAVTQQDYNSISAGIITIGFCIIFIKILSETLIFIADPLNKKGWYAK